MLQVIFLMCLVVAGFAVRVDEMDGGVLSRTRDTCACNQEQGIVERRNTLITWLSGDWQSVDDNFCLEQLHTHKQKLETQQVSTLKAYFEVRGNNEVLKTTTDALSNALQHFKADINLNLNGKDDPCGVKAAWDKLIADAEIVVSEGARFMEENEDKARALLEQQEATIALQKAIEGFHIPVLERAVGKAIEKKVANATIAKGNGRLKGLKKAADTFRAEEAKGRAAVNGTETELEKLKGIMETIANMRGELGPQVPGHQAVAKIGELMGEIKQKTKVMKSTLETIASGADFLESNATA